MRWLSITPTVRATGTIVVVLHGSLRRADTTVLAETVGALLRTHRPTRMEMDVSRLLELEPGTAEAVLAVLGTAAREGTTIVVTHPSPRVRAQLSSAGAEGYLA
ncbi:STAS domain-containing protein [Micromonospora siamensis]|uniref:STAS domain-containing protein n=1 Tax=Micromonospora siamensis TaxID=299152 RepID=A0A1C5I7V4_9ACTN|nr:STAS domain-containing protein [Micromonospora siamensis]SCG54265.1 STAS domain-containing protein [Micromonospora siamensis]